MSLSSVLSQDLDKKTPYDVSFIYMGQKEKMINHALFIQIAIYFFMPLSLAIIHSYVGISVVNNIVSVAGNINIVSNTFYTALVFLIIYGGYFFATYLGSRSMIKAKRN